MATEYRFQMSHIERDSTLSWRKAEEKPRPTYRLPFVRQVCATKPGRVIESPIPVLTSENSFSGGIKFLDFTIPTLSPAMYDKLPDDDI